MSFHCYLGIFQVSKSGIVEAHGMCQHILRKKCLILCVRPNSGSSKLQTEGEKLIIAKLKEKFPGAKDIEVSDISGGSVDSDAWNMHVFLRNITFLILSCTHA